MTGSPAHVIAGCFALSAFAVAIVAGLAAGNAAVSIMLRAVVALVACYPIGLAAGILCQRVADDPASRRSACPVPSATESAPPGGSAAREAGGTAKDAPG